MAEFLASLFVWVVVLPIASVVLALLVFGLMELLP